jgi:hypothetical protein
MTYEKLLWKIILITILCTLIAPSAFSQGFSGWINLRGSSSETLEDGETTSEIDQFSQNNNFNYTNFITQNLTYQLNLRTRYTDENTTSAEGIEDSSHSRGLRPSIALSLINPMYSLSAGYLRDENWTTARITDESRDTSEDYYSRFHLTPTALPSLSLQFDREENFDHLSPKEKDETNNRYSATTTYDLPSRDIKLNYSATYTHTKNETPLKVIKKIESDDFNGNYRIAYTRNFWNNRTSISLSYQGNFSWTESDSFSSETGDVLFRRTPFGGLYAQGTALQPDVDVLDTVGWSALVDENFNSGLSINLSIDRFHNIGISVSSDKPVDRLYIYVNKDVRTDTNLTNKDNWEVYRSNFNRPGTWTEISIDGVLLNEFDMQEDVYRYEIIFSEPQNASFFNAVTLETVNALGVTDALVTEIEAYGTDMIPVTGKLTNESKSLNQRLNLNASFVPFRKLSFSFNYSINDSVTRFDSFSDAFTNIFENIFSKSTNVGDDDTINNTTRSYGGTARWQTHRLLITRFSFERFDSFDNLEETDTTSDTYLISFHYSPLSTLETNLSLTRTESKKFDEKDSTRDSIILSADANLYKDINMITDLSYTESESFATEADPDEGETEAYSVSSTIDASLRKDLFADLRYNFQHRSSETTSVSSHNGITSITYRPGRLINIRGNFSISHSEGNTSTSEGFSFDWLPLPAIRTSIAYQHADIEPGSIKTDDISSNVSWKITKFMNAELSYIYSRRKEDTKSERHIINASLNCSF